MFDDDINSNCDAENETYWDIKFRQMVKDLAWDIADIIVDLLDKWDDEGWQ